MSLLFMDSFSHYASADLLKKYNALSNATYVTIDSTGGRRGGGCVKGRYDDGEYLKYSLSSVIPNTNYLFAGFAYKFNTTAASNIFLILSEYSNILWLTRNSNGTLTVKSYVTSLATSEKTIDIDTWYYIEIKCNIHDTTGVFKVLVNGETWIDFTGDTKYSSSFGTDITSVSFHAGDSSTCYQYFCDFYLCDSTGATNNDFLGDCRVDCILPSAAGNYSQLTPLSGDNYTNVDENPIDDSSYVSGITNGLKDSYDFSAAPSGLGVIAGIQTTPAVLRTAASDTIKEKPLIRIASTDYNGTAVSLPDTVQFKPEIIETDPSDSAVWTKAKIDATEFGIEVVVP